MPNLPGVLVPILFGLLLVDLLMLLVPDLPEVLQLAKMWVESLFRSNKMFWVVLLETELPEGSKTELPAMLLPLFELPEETAVRSGASPASGELTFFICIDL